MCGSGYPTNPNFYSLPGTINSFSSFQSNCSSGEEIGRLGMHFKGFLSLIVEEKHNYVFERHKVFKNTFLSIILLSKEGIFILRKEVFF